MFLSFLDRPDTQGQVWLDHGGLQTIESFGLRASVGSRSAAALIALRDSVAAAVGPELVAWLRGLPRWIQSGNVIVTHAGADPRRSLDDQPPGGLVWGDARWPDEARSDGNWLVHGHFPLARCRIRNRHISVDTGAYYTGMLSAVLIDQGTIRFLDVTRGSRP
jgi:serine/threonine protein phosphatase 1